MASASAEQFTHVVIPLSAELTRGHPPPVFESGASRSNQFHHGTYSMIGSLVVLAGMVCLIKGVGQTS